MLGRAADHLNSSHDDTVVEIARNPTENVLGRKIWLPKLIYAALPCFYILAGLGALGATIFVGEWFWVLPHYLLFAAACLHMGFLILRRRSRAAKDSDETPHDG